MKFPTTLAHGLAAAFLCVGMALAPTLASATAKDDYLGKTEAEITATLEQAGYQVRKVEEEDGTLEAYALRDGQKFEIYVNAEDGKVVEIKQDD